MTPPAVGDAVNVTLVPSQTGFWLAAIATNVIDMVFTVMVIVFEVAGLPVGHDWFDVNTQ